MSKRHAPYYARKPASNSVWESLKWLQCFFPVFCFYSTWIGIVSTAQAQPTYTITNLGSGASLTPPHSVSINNAGQVAGENGANNPFLYTDGQKTNLGSVNGSTFWPRAINSLGDVTGGINSNAVSQPATLFSQGAAASIGTVQGFSQTVGTAINSSDEITGYAKNFSGPLEAALYRNGTWTDMGFLGTGWGINDNGDIVGQYYPDSSSPSQAFLYSGGVLKTLGTLGGIGAIAYGVSPGGEVVGQSTITGNNISHAFSYSGSSMTDLGIISGEPSNNNSLAVAVNSSGEIVGEVYPTNSNSYTAFVYLNGQMFDLNSLIPTNLGWNLMQATGVNDSGQIVGWGTLNGGGAGTYYNFLLTPTVLPEPSSAFIFLVFGVGTLGRFRSIRKAR
jgi:probable HAF family extracellular repeat protein